MVRRNVALGGLMGVVVGVYTVVAVMLAGLSGGVLTLTIIVAHVISALLLVLRYHRGGLGVVIEAIVAQLLAYIAFTPPLYTLALRLVA